MYSIYRGEGWHNKKLDSFIVQSTVGSWRYAHQGKKPGFFSGNNRYYVYEDRGGLNFLELGSSKQHSVNEITSYKLPADNKQEWVAWQLNNCNVLLHNMVTGEDRNFGEVSLYEFDKTNQWLICRPKAGLNELIAYNLSSKREYRFQFVKEYSFGTEGKVMFTIEEKLNNAPKSSLCYTNFEGNVLKTLWSTTDTTVRLNKYTTDKSGNQVVFSVRKNGELFIWYWKNDMDNAVMLIDNNTSELKDKHLVGNESFYCNDACLKISLRNRRNRQDLNPPAGNVSVTIWSYNDLQLQSGQYLIMMQVMLYILLSLILKPRNSFFGSRK